jgi:hypothetical protein
VTTSVDTLPAGNAAATNAVGRTPHGCRAACANAPGADIDGRMRRGRRSGSEGCDASTVSVCSIKRRPSGDTMPAVARAARSGPDKPARINVPTIDPAEVPTMISASRASHPVASASAARTPAWKAWPVAPPAPRTSPILAVVLDIRESAANYT